MTAMNSPWIFYDLACSGATASVNPYAPPTSTRTPPTSTPTCGFRSYSGSTNAYGFDFSGQYNTPALCGARCQQDYRCYSSAVSYNDVYCLLFAVGVYVSIILSPTLLGSFILNMFFPAPETLLKAASRPVRGYFTTSIAQICHQQLHLHLLLAPEPRVHTSSTPITSTTAIITTFSSNQPFPT
jgi:hypothetical protein